MSRAVTIALGCALFGLAAPASAQQEMYPGQNVVVNPRASGTQVLLYPDGSHTRVVPQLLQPGQNPNQVIHLHMPVKHRVVHRVRKPVTEVAAVDVPGYNLPPETRMAEVPPAPKPVAPRGVAPKPVLQKLAAAPVPQKPVAPKPAAPKPTATASTGSAALPFSFDPRTTDYTPPPAEPAKTTRLAAASPPPARTEPSADNGLTRRSQIIFAAGAPDPAANALDAIRMLGGDLNASLNGGASRIQLQAYGGARKDKSSDARRLSLKRALAIRQILIDAGVPSGKIDVRAMGGADSGPPDRVDVYLRG
jgi:outer membrane protein OmpA-like peptidoglycan-associated protein